MIQSEKCKILLLGQSAVGKTSLFKRFAGNPNEKVTPTIGAEYKQKILPVENNKHMKIQLWDTAGTQRYRTISPIYYRNLDGVLLVFDITDESSFRGLQYWIDELNERGEDYEIALVGNKNDQEERREVSRAKGEEKAREMGVAYFETNSLQMESVHEVFAYLVDKIVQKRERGGLSVTEFATKRSEFQSLRVTDLPRKKSNQQSDCC